MTRVAYATHQTELLLGIEATRGTPATTLFALPVKSPKYKPDLNVITDDTLQGNMTSTQDLIRGLRYDSHGWDSYPYLDSFPVLLRCLLGSADTVTAAPASTTLAAPATVGALTASITGVVTAGQWIVIGTGAVLETHRITSVSGIGPYVATLDYAVKYAHASGETVTGLTKHEVSLLNNAGSGNQPPSATILDYDGEEWRQITSAQLDKLTLKGNATGLVEYTVDWMGDPATTPSTPSTSFTDVRATPGWTLNAAVAGTAIDHLVDWQLTFARKVKPIPALTGTQSYYLFFADAIDVSGKLTFVEQSGAPELTQYLAGTQESLDLSFYDVASGYAMRAHSSRAQFKTGELDRSKEYVEATLDIELLPSAADALAGGKSPILFDVANAQITAY
jgi:hypothetical protein